MVIRTILLIYVGEGSSHGVSPLHLLAHSSHSRERSSHFCFGERFGRTREGLSDLALLFLSFLSSNLCMLIGVACNRTW